MNRVSDLVVDVARIREVPGLSAAFVLRTQAASLLKDRPDLSWSGNVVVSGQVTNEEQVLHVVGRVEAQAQAICARCLAPVPYSVVAPLDERYVAQRRHRGPEPLDEPDSDRSGDRQPAEDDAVDPPRSYRGDFLDLSSVVQEAVWLELPSRVLCRPDCRGLCPHCGQSLNEGPCGCGAAPPQRDAWQEALREKVRFQQERQG